MIEVLRSDTLYDLMRLSEDAAIARSIQDFSQGAYGHSISLPLEHQVGEKFRPHHNNVPYSGALERCPYLREIFDSFQTEKVSFRLLRRGAKSAYALHDDKDKGTKVMRFQIPIITNEHAFLVLPHEDLDYELYNSYVSDLIENSNGDIWFDLEKLDQAGGGKFEIFYLEPGYLYYFDTDKIHTLVNAGDEERITLSIDLVMNDWLDRWMQTNLKHRVVSSPNEKSQSVAWIWNSLRHGIIRNS